MFSWALYVLLWPQLEPSYILTNINISNRNRKTGDDRLKKLEKVVTDMQLKIRDMATIEETNKIAKENNFILQDLVKIYTPPSSLVTLRPSPANSVEGL